MTAGSFTIAQLRISEGKKARFGVRLFQEASGRAAKVYYRLGGDVARSDIDKGALMGSFKAYSNKTKIVKIGVAADNIKEGVEKVTIEFSTDPDFKDISQRLSTSDLSYSSRLPGSRYSQVLYIAEANRSKKDFITGLASNIESPGSQSDDATALYPLKGGETQYGKYFLLPKSGDFISFWVFADSNRNGSFDRGDRRLKNIRLGMPVINRSATFSGASLRGFIYDTSQQILSLTRDDIEFLAWSGVQNFF